MNLLSGHLFVLSNHLRNIRNALNIRDPVPVIPERGLLFNRVLS
jgi:hypothetical protein